MLSLVKFLIWQIIISEDIRIELLLVAVGDHLPCWLACSRICVQIAAIRDAYACLL